MLAEPEISKGHWRTTIQTKALNPYPFWFPITEAVTQTQFSSILRTISPTPLFGSFVAEIAACVVPDFEENILDVCIAHRIVSG